MYRHRDILNNIRKARSGLNYTQDYLAYKLNISRSAYTKIELGYIKITLEKLKQIAEILGTDVHKLIGITNIQSAVKAVNDISFMPKMLEVICQVTGMGFAVVSHVTAETWVACCVHDGISFGMQPGDELTLETTICNEIRLSGNLVVIDNVAKDATFCFHQTPVLYGFQSYISVPINDKNGRFFGTLCAFDPKPNKLNNSGTIGMFKLFAEIISPCLSLIRYNKMNHRKTRRLQIVK